MFNLIKIFKYSLILFRKKWLGIHDFIVKDKLNGRHPIGKIDFFNFFYFFYFILYL